MKKTKITPANIAISGTYLTPRQIVAELNKYIIGQNDAKKIVAIALRNRWRRQMVKSDLQDEIIPNNIIMIGPTGVGKTEIARRLAKLSGAPFVKVEATKYTEVGYVGRDVESMVRDLVERSVAIVREEQMTTKQKEAHKAAEARVLDILLPPVTSNNEEDSPTEENTETREKMKELLISGDLNDKTIELDVLVDSSPSVNILGPLGMDEMGMNLKEMLDGMLPKKSKKKKYKVSEAITIIQKEEIEKLIDMENIIKEALARAENNGIVFIDEIDKVASKNSERSGGAEVSREGVQRDLLPIVEGCSVNTKYGQVHTDHILFIASGAFHTSKPADLIPELQGRFPIRVELKSLTEEDLVRILTIPENALIKQYEALMAAENVKLTFDKEAIKEIASIAAKVNDEVTNIGARRLHTILTTLLEDFMFNIPDSNTDKEIVITAGLVKETLKNISKNIDLSKFIL